MNTILVKKLGMTSLFAEDGRLLGVTALKADRCIVTQIRSQERDGYVAVQLAAGRKRTINKPMQGQLKDITTAKPARFKEVRMESVEGYEMGKLLSVEAFKTGDKINITGLTQGKGFAGTIKRHHFGRGPMSHGHDHHRAVGAIGASAHPGRIVKGKRMPGGMGNDRITVKNLEVVRVDPENQILYVAGAVPGKKGRVVLVREALNRKGV
jgi:large subunit ribosomal protein L3